MGSKEVYQGVTAEEAERQLAQFEEERKLARFEDARAASCPVVARSWRQNRSLVVPMFSYPE